MEPERPTARSSVEGNDIDQARGLYEDAYHGREFAIEPTEQSFAYRYNVAGNADVTLRGNLFLGSVEGTIQTEGEYIVTWITAGSGSLDLGDDGAMTPLVPGRPVLFRTGGENSFRFADYKQNLIHLDAEYLERIAAEHEGSAGGRLEFDHTAQPDDAALRRWTGTVRMLGQTVLQGQQSALLQSEANRLAATSLLDTFAHRTATVPRELLLPKHRRIREAVEYMHANAHLPITVADVARVTELSVRGLQQAFERTFATSPMRYLRMLRLDRAREDLMAETRGAVTVAEIARRWGFTHMGRFSMTYAERFGEHPRDTLRR